MMMKEFTERTGVTPTFQEYRDIEADYYAFDGDKDAFCKAWVAAGGPMATVDAFVQPLMFEPPKVYKMPAYR